MSSDSELLVGLSHDELEVLADRMLAPSSQSRLTDLLERNAENRLDAEETSPRTFVKLVNATVSTGLFGMSFHFTLI